jgi:hypothetical protein
MARCTVIVQGVPPLMESRYILVHIALRVRHV